MELLILLAVLLILFFCIEWLIRQLKIDHYEQRYVLITGCDTGFGNELAKRLDMLKFKVFACCLTKAAVMKFDREGSSNLKAVEMDVSRDASIDKAMEIVKRTLPKDKGLWAVVNNAGVYGAFGSINMQTRQDYENTLAVNLYGVIMVTQACMPLILREKGRVVNTASVLGRLATLGVAYSISKFGVEAFSDILRRENYRTGVKVAIVEPGAFKTAIYERKSIRKGIEAKVASLPADIRAQLPKDAADQMEAKVHKIGDSGSTKTYEVVDAYTHAITAKFPKKRYLVGLDAKYILRLLVTVPECISDFFVEPYSRPIYKKY